MIEGPLVFVDIDTQRDFLDPAGVLFIPGSEAIVPNLARLTARRGSEASPCWRPPAPMLSATPNCAGSRLTA